MLSFNLKKVFFLTFMAAVWQLTALHPFFLSAVTGGILAVWHRGFRKLGLPDTLFIGAFLLNLVYVTGSMGNVRQYDYFNFYMHADYFLSNNFFIGNPAAYFQRVFFQPPLWGLVAGAVTKIVMLTGQQDLSAFDYVRFVSLFCVMGAGIIFWRLMTELHLSERFKIPLFAFFLFFPTNTILANLVNNDAAVYFLMLVMISTGLKWSQSGEWRSALSLSLLLFAGGMIKFSSLMVAPALCVLMLYRLFLEKDKQSLSLWGQFGVIAVGGVCGFSWGFLLLYFNLPLVPPPVDVGWQSMAGYSLMQRFFDFGSISFPFADILKGRVEPNVWLALVKTSLFGEWSWQGKTAAYVLYGLGVLWAGFAVWSFFILYKHPANGNWGFNLLTITLVFTVIAAWMHFWLAYPYFCSSEFRYVAILFPLSLLWFGLWLDATNPPKAVRSILAGGLVLFILAWITLVLNTI